jgi:hypothetical protein
VNKKLLYLGLGICTIFLALSCASAYSKLTDSERQNLDKLSGILQQGKWRFEDKNCSTAYLTLQFNKQNSTILAVSKLEDAEEPNEYIYDILSISDQSIFTSIQDEKRLDDKGNPVKWHLMLVDNNSFYWRRDDWDLNSGTKHMILCQ